MNNDSQDVPTVDADVSGVGGPPGAQQNHRRGAQPVASAAAAAADLAAVEGQTMPAAAAEPGPVSSPPAAVAASAGGGPAGGGGPMPAAVSAPSALEGEVPAAAAAAVLPGPVARFSAAVAGAAAAGPPGGGEELPAPAAANSPPAVPADVSSPAAAAVVPAAAAAAPSAGTEWLRSFPAAPRLSPEAAESVLEFLASREVVPAGSVIDLLDFRRPVAVVSPLVPADVDDAELGDDEFEEGGDSEEESVAGGEGGGGEEEEDDEEDEEDEEEEEEEDEEEDEDEDKEGEDSEGMSTETELQHLRATASWWDINEFCKRKVREERERNRENKRRRIEAGEVPSDESSSFPEVDSEDDPDNSYYPPRWTKYWRKAFRVEEPLFHKVVEKIARYLAGQKPPFVRCPICTTTQLSIRGLLLYTSPDPDERAELPDLKPGVVLICGHMICKPCWAQTVHHHKAQAQAPNNDNPQPLGCPICRVELTHTQCGCELPALDMPANEKDRDNCPPEDYRQFYRYHDDEWARGFPTTLVEGGERPAQCARHVREAAVREARRRERRAARLAEREAAREEARRAAEARAAVDAAGDGVADAVNLEQ